MWWNNIEITAEFKERLNDEKDKNNFAEDTRGVLEIDEDRKCLCLYSNPKFHKEKILIGVLQIEEDEYDLCVKLIKHKDQKTALLHIKSQSELIRNISKSLINGTRVIKSE